LGKVSSGGGKELSIRIISITTLVVELDIVPIDQITNLLVDGSVTTIGILSEIGEIGRLRSMSKDILSLGKNGSDNLSTGNQPSLTLSSLTSGIILIIQINTIETVILGKVSQSSTTLCGIFGSRIIESTEGGNNDSLSGIMESLS